MTRIAKAKRCRSGNGARRRRREVSREKLSWNIVVAARDLFLKQGFDSTSMEAIASRAGTTKRAVYSRYGDKSTLFNRAIYDLLGRLDRPLKVPGDAAGNIESALLYIARCLVSDALTWQQMVLQRVFASEAQHSPDIAQWIIDERRKPAIHVIETILKRHQNELRVGNSGLAAEQFASAIFDCYERLASLRYDFDPEDVEDRITSAVNVFLSSIRREAPRCPSGRAIGPSRGAGSFALADAA